MFSIIYNCLSYRHKSILQQWVIGINTYLDYLVFGAGGNMHSFIDFDKHYNNIRKRRKKSSKTTRKTEIKSDTIGI